MSGRSGMERSNIPDSFGKYIHPQLAVLPAGRESVLPTQTPVTPEAEPDV